MMQECQFLPIPPLQPKAQVNAMTYWPSLTIIVWLSLGFLPNKTKFVMKLEIFLKRDQVSRPQTEALEAGICEGKNHPL